MGEIVVRIKSNKKRHYILDDADAAGRLIESLDRTAVRVKNKPATAEDIEFAEDASDVRKAVNEYERTGKSHNWEDVKAKLGL